MKYYKVTITTTAGDVLTSTQYCSRPGLAVDRALTEGLRHAQVRVDLKSTNAYRGRGLTIRVDPQ